MLQWKGDCCGGGGGGGKPLQASKPANIKVSASLIIHTWSEAMWNLTE